jgi:cytochrome c-type biogenesis protein
MAVNLSDVGFLMAFLGGLISFLSPCVLPLVPPYLSYLAGTSVSELSARSGEDKALQRRVLLAAALFVLGFTTVFVLLGLTATGLGRLLQANLHWLSRVAGVVIILMGLNFLGVFRISLFYREARAQSATPTTLWGAYPMGLAFAFGWTPCIGPILSVILGVAAGRGSVLEGGALLFVYSLGLGVPFLLAAFAVKPFSRFLNRFKHHLGLMEKIMGGLLVLAGILFLTGGLQIMAYWLLETFPLLSKFG